MRDTQDFREPPDDPTLWIARPSPDSRAQGLRRLSRLTWRTTQLSTIAAAAFAVLFARSAPTQGSTGEQTVARPASTPTASAAPDRHHHKGARKPGPGHPARTSTPRASSAPAPQPTSSASPSPTPTRTTPAPPTTPPAPAPKPSPTPTPTPTHTTTSPSPSGG